MKKTDFWTYRALAGGRWHRKGSEWRTVTSGEWSYHETVGDPLVIDTEDHSSEVTILRVLCAATAAMIAIFICYVSTYF